ncbi:hypothetical protein LTR78_008333 [Recurvomyces mirabilis]|uniref:Protein kinase domain-containing protein n=1 Tax=Recurvomyces mirabilis TaxID=574656 RepID=A0AAE0WFS4_9PEZI|nr:hypothetical protein LTR78_008333 [Recurvomyces mirabilis]KAK5158540.1 hypothetical protein LTS14_003560 [Recurvomyces mirabilis]
MGNIQPEVHRAPETLMQFESYSSAVDIWNVGCVLWDMLEVEHLFDGRDEDGQHNNRVHMHEIVSLLGNPPTELLRRSPQTWRLFDESGIYQPSQYVSCAVANLDVTGQWGAKPAIDHTSLEDGMKNVALQKKTQVIQILANMLRWLPEKKATARELLEHPWMQDDRPRSGFEKIEHFISAEQWDIGLC